MPATFVHPIAVLPLRRLCPARLNLAALAIGSMSPDFVYGVGQFQMGRLSHSLPGSFIVCLPAGFLALGIFYGLREPLAFILPQPHRSALMPLAAARPSLSPWFVLKAVASILLGAWTHIIWDSFTHHDGWAVRHISFLRGQLFLANDNVFHVYDFLHQLCTLGGSAFLIVAYVVWLRNRRSPAAVPSEAASDRGRYFLLTALALVASGVAVLMALSNRGASFLGFAGFQAFAFRTAVASIAIFAPLLAIASAVFFLASRRGAEPYAREDRKT
jgi:small-conductance mechanosensitive channel